MQSTMSGATQEDGERSNSQLFGAILRILYAIRGSFLVFVLAVGIVWTAVGLYLQEGVIAAMLVIWGVSAILYAGIGYGSLKLIKYN